LALLDFALYKTTWATKLWMSVPTMVEIEELEKKIQSIESQRAQEILTLVEILSNATFFGEIKKTTCEYSENGQCSFYTLEAEAKNKMPIVTDCRIRGCRTLSNHCHIELSNIACALCQNKNSNATERPSPSNLAETNNTKNKYESNGKKKKLR
jgi:hypothetical protein